MMEVRRIKGETWEGIDSLSSEDAAFLQEHDDEQCSLHIITEQSLDKLAKAGMNSRTVAILRGRVKADGYKDIRLVVWNE